MQTYHVSIIDIFQLWNFEKKGEQFLKCQVMRRCDPSVLSAVEPIFYKERFQAFLKKQVFVKTREWSSPSKTQDRNVLEFPATLTQDNRPSLNNIRESQDDLKFDILKSQHQST